MSVIRREGDWRLEKRADGVYEITFRHEPHARIYTADAQTDVSDQSAFDVIPAREVTAYSDVEALFEETIDGPPPLGMEHVDPELDEDFSSNESEEDPLYLSELPPGGLAAVLVLAGSGILYLFWGGASTVMVLTGVALLAMGAAIFGYAGYLFRTRGIADAVEFLGGSFANHQRVRSMVDEIE